jgi:hypothetical protein
MEIVSDDRPGSLSGTKDQLVEELDREEDRDGSDDAP